MLWTLSCVVMCVPNRAWASVRSRGRKGKPESALFACPLLALPNPSASRLEHPPIVLSDRIHLAAVFSSQVSGV
jgi:hypothetical protein